jgi:hypothetical protein
VAVLAAVVVEAVVGGGGGGGGGTQTTTETSHVTQHDGPNIEQHHREDSEEGMVPEEVLDLPN